MKWQQTQQGPLAQLAQLPLLTYDVPIIRPAPEPKKKNPIIRALKKFVYFKPKTFLGTTFLTTVLGILITAGLKWPTEQQQSPPRPVDRIENRINTPATNQTEKTVDMADFLTFYNLYIGYQKATQLMVCPCCNDIANITTTSGNQIQATCIKCQKPLQILKTDSVYQKE